jgi:SAM-dependent methyltransferase
MPELTPDAAEVLDREREFHNERFADDEARAAQGKYYFAIRDCDETYEAALVEHARGAVALDYGCALGDYALKLAPIAKEVQGIDISDVAIEAAKESAKAQGLTNAHFAVMDAQATSFPDAYFDFVFGIGIIHHLETERSLREVARILKPGGVAIFREPLGGNPVIDLYRAFTPQARTVDEHPLRRADLEISRKIFSRSDWRFYGLATLASVPLRNSALGEAAFKATAALDRLLFKLPPVRWMAWNALMVMEK